MAAWGGVIRVRPPGRVSHGPLPDLLNGVVGECLAAAMLGEPDRFGNTGVEADHVVFPVPDVVPQPLAEDCGTEVEGVEVGVEDVHDVSGAGDGNYGCGGGGCEACGGGFCAGEPAGEGAGVEVGG